MTTKKNKKRRIAILTGGGDAPGLNAVIRAVVRSAIWEHGWEVYGVRNGYDGFLEPDGVYPLTLEHVLGILPRGGTILGAANRGDPFARKEIRDGREVLVDVSGKIVQRAKEMHLDAVIVVGGDGTLKAALRLFDMGLPVVGVPKTIDNDVNGTDYTIGFDTAVQVATDALDRLHSTAEAHHRVMVVELMGRHAGFLALHGGLAGGADVILIPEIPFHFEVLAEAVRQRVYRRRQFSIFAVAEGAYPVGGQPVYRRKGDALTAPRLGGISEVVARYIEEATGIESRFLILGHLQRGGSPSATDRVLGTRFGTFAVELIAQDRLGVMTALRGDAIVPVSLKEALSQHRNVDPNGQLVRTARQIGVYFGDETWLLQEASSG